MMSFYSIKDVVQIKAQGPWHSKSGGILEVLFALPQLETERFLGYDNLEFERIAAEHGHNIRGLRSYTVSNIAKDSIGGKEWHKARSEYLFAPKGSADVECTDIYGNKAVFPITATEAIIIPPTVFHTYIATDEDTSLQVICNTLFIPEKPETHDTFSHEEFTQNMETA